MKKIFVIFLFLSLPFYLNALVIGEDGLYEQPWIIETFKDLNEDLEEANQDQKRLMILFEQKGCGYCKRMHEKVYSIPEIATTLQDDFFVIRINIFGDLEVTDFDGETLPEKEIIKKTVKKLYPDLDNLNDVITQAEQKENDSNHIQEFTKDVKSLSTENKILIVETLWRIILSDGKSDIYENNLMRRLAGLLYLDDKIVGETKVKVLNNK